MPGSIALASSSAPSAGAIGAGGASGSSGKPTARHFMKTPYQLEVLEQTYTEDPYPNEAKRVELSAKLGLTDRQLQMWFCHRRLKERRPPAKQQQQQLGKEVAVPVMAPPPVLQHSLPHPHPHGEQLLPCSSSRRGPGRSSVVPRISAPEIDRRYYDSHQVMLPPHAPVQLTRVAHRVIETVQQLIGEPLREDGPVLGDHFDPLPPDVFGAPMRVVPEQRKPPYRSHETSVFSAHDPKPMKMFTFIHVPWRALARRSQKKHSFWLIGASYTSIDSSTWIF